MPRFLMGMIFVDLESTLLLFNSQLHLTVNYFSYAGIVLEETGNEDKRDALR